MQTIGQDPEERSGGGKDLEGEGESESAADLNDYLNELSGENGGSESDSEDAVDVSEYMKESKDPDPTAGT